jgi:FKBP-type peptidyl-prolyl cis-trans isomerase SlyD
MSAGGAAVVGAGMLVSLKVRLYDAQGNLLEATDAPLVYLHGAADIFPKIEQVLDGRALGEDVSVRLEPADAFGDDDPSLVHVLPKAQLGGDVALGMRFEGVPGQPPDGRTYTVIDLAQDVAVLDGNHPLAGRALRFDLTVVGIEPAGDAQREPGQGAGVHELLRVAPAHHGHDGDHAHAHAHDHDDDHDDDDDDHDDGGDGDPAGAARATRH